VGHRGAQSIGKKSIKGADDHLTFPETAAALSKGHQQMMAVQMSLTDTKA